MQTIYAGLSGYNNEISPRRAHRFVAMVVMGVTHGRHHQTTFGISNATNRTLRQLKADTWDIRTRKYIYSRK